MKVLLIDVNCKGSSTGQIVYNLYSFLNKNGDEAAVCYGRGKKIKENNIYKFGLDWETYLHAFLTRITGYTGCFSYFSTRRLIKFIENYNPDVVHIHELHAYFVNIAQLLKYLAKKNIKVVHTLHCEFSYTGKCGHSVECDKWKNTCDNCPHLSDYPSTLFFDHTKTMHQQKKKYFENLQFLTIVTPSQWLANRAKESFFKNRNIEVIHNGVDISIFKPVVYSNLKKQLGIKNDEIVVLSVAPNLMSNEKGGRFVLDIAEKLKKQPVRFVMIGIDHPEEIHESNIIAMGRINDKSLLAKYYSMADLFLICSERENYPTTCLEAQACGTAICGFDTGGTKETSIFSNNVFVEYGNIEIIIKEINKIVLTGHSKDTLIEHKNNKNLIGINNFLSESVGLYRKILEE